MLILKRYIGESINVQDGSSDYGITVQSIEQDKVTLNVAGQRIVCYAGDVVDVPRDGSMPLLVVIDRVGERYARLGFQGDITRRVRRVRRRQDEVA